MKDEQVDMALLWELYRDFCIVACGTQDMKSDCATDFLGFLDKTDQVGVAYKTD